MMTANSSNQYSNQYSKQFLHNTFYAKQAQRHSLNKITIEEPLKPYADFQQLKMTKVKMAKVKQLKSTAEKKPKPFIQLQGQWLAKAGFSINKNCLIEVYKGMLVITLDEPINKDKQMNP